MRKPQFTIPKSKMAAKMREVFENLLRDTVKSAFAMWWSCSDAIVEPEGGYFE